MCKLWFYRDQVGMTTSVDKGIYGRECFCTNDSVRAGDDVIDILTSEDMENTPLESRM